MSKVKVIKQWKHYKVDSVYKFTAAEIKALKALGYVVDYEEEQEVTPKESELPKETKKRTYKRKDLKAED